MKALSVARARALFRDALAWAQELPVVVTKYGRPIAVLHGVEGTDLRTLEARLTGQRRRRRKAVA